MTPKEIVQSAFETSILPTLEPEGFTYSRSQFTFKRKAGEFVQQISVTLSHDNTQDSIRFWSAFNISSPRYNRWLAQNGRAKSDGCLGGGQDTYIPGWCEAVDSSLDWDFSDPASRSEVLDEWRRRCFVAGLPYLTLLSSWRGAAEDWLRQNRRHERAADFFLIAGLKENAIAALQAGLIAIDQEAIAVSANAHPVLIRKRELEAEDRKKRKAAIIDRIASLQIATFDA